MTNITLPSEVTVFNAQQCWQVLRGEFLQKTLQSPQQLDISVVEELDGCGAQLLWFVREILAKKSIEFNVISAGPEVKQTLITLGMQALILED